MARRPELVKADETASVLGEFSQVVRSSQMTDHSRRGVLNSIETMRDDLEQLERDIDPVRMPEAFFDPSEPRLIGHFVALALISQERRRLGELVPFYGAGIYAIYYNGPSSTYAPISETETPIYVGKADPPSGAKSVVDQQTKLFHRLNEHRRNIEKVQGIDLADFECRALAVQSGFQTAAENHLIQLFKPIWNNETKILFGIGKHGDKADTRTNKRSPWDTVHPGRKWAAESPEGKSIDEITADVANHFQSTTIFQSTDTVFGAFADGIRQADHLR